VAIGDDASPRRMANALGVPLLRFLDVSPVDPSDPRAGVSIPPTPNAMNAVDALHAGVISTVLEIAAYLALLPDLSDDEEAVSHGLSISYIGRADGDGPLIASGQVLRRTRRLAFVTAELRQDERVLAAAQVTKSIYAIPAGG
jgi:uncharacterized protein (TIGR00369 family)